MKRYLTASEAGQRFLQLIDEAQGGDQIVVTKRGAPAVVLIDFERLTRSASPRRISSRDDLYACLASPRSESC